MYQKNYNVPVVSLRYFTVYGPRQRPDMAIHKFVKAILNNEEIAVFGDGTQTRDFTYVDDVVEATISAADRISFRKFLGFPDDIPDYSTVWYFRDRLAKTGKDRAIWGGTSKTTGLPWAHGEAGSGSRCDVYYR